MEMIVEDLRTMPPSELEKAAVLIQHLKETRRASRLDALNGTAGAWAGPEGEAIGKAIRDNCEGIGSRD
jgi:hypothetical protein